MHESQTQTQGYEALEFTFCWDNCKIIVIYAYTVIYSSKMKMYVKIKFLRSSGAFLTTFISCELRCIVYVVLSSGTLRKSDVTEYPHIGDHIRKWFEIELKIKSDTYSI